MYPRRDAEAAFEVRDLLVHSQNHLNRGAALGKGVLAAGLGPSGGMSRWGAGERTRRQTRYSDPMESQRVSPVLAGKSKPRGRPKLPANLRELAPRPHSPSQTAPDDFRPQPRLGHNGLRFPRGRDGRTDYWPTSGRADCLRKSIRARLLKYETVDLVSDHARRNR